MLFLTEYYPGPGETFTGGVETRSWHVTRALAERHDVTVVTSRRAGEPRRTKEGRLVIRRVGLPYPYSNEGYVLKRLWWAVSALLRALRVRADVIEGTSFLTYVPAALAGWMKRIPRIATYHETWVGGQWIQGKGWWTGGLGELWERLALRLRWTRIISVSEFTRDGLVDAGIPDRLIEVVPNGIDLDEFGIDVPKAGHSTVACISRLISTKRVDVLIRAIPDVVRQVPDLHVEVVGVGAEEEPLHRLADDVGVADRVSFLGRVDSNEEVRRIVKRAHAFALPSESEGFGIVVLEAMASGVPVACSDIPPLRELTAGQGALLFRPGDPGDLAGKLIALLTDKGMYERKVAEASERAQEFAWPKVLRRIDAIYTDVTGAGTGS
jgi:glycosyltransferase involved in cell wall biosynthesis